MDVPISQARRRLSDLVRRAEAGEEVILTRRGQATVRLVVVRHRPDRAARTALLRAVRAAAVGKVKGGPAADRSQDVLYGEDGMP